MGSKKTSWFSETPDIRKKNKDSEQITDNDQVGITTLGSGWAPEHLCWNTFFIIALFRSGIFFHLYSTPLQCCAEQRCCAMQENAAQFNRGVVREVICCPLWQITSIFLRIFSPQTLSLTSSPSPRNIVIEAATFIHLLWYLVWGSN